MVYSRVKKLNWYLGRLTLICIVWFIVGVSIVGIEPMRNHSLISSILLLINGVSMLVEHLMWQRKKNPRPLKF